MANEPLGVKLRTYHVGFGDCFLLSFRYETGERHVLIDFGTTREPPNKDKVLLRVAENIRSRITENPNGELTAVIATHRHKDHIEGFRTASNNGGPGDVIRACLPKLVIQPWTEDPDLDTAAEEPNDPDSGRRFRLALADLHAISDAIHREARVYSSLGLEDEMGFLGENNLANISAVKNLIEMGKAAKAEYVYAGFQTSLSELLPGVNVSVLGPPTLKQSKAIKRQRAKDEDEFWHLWRHTMRPMKLGMAQDQGERSGEARSLFQCGSQYSPAENPPQFRWFRRKMLEMRGRELLELVRTLDTVLNNTSVILLFEVGGKKLLFPGDAQIENWSFALDDEETRNKLKDVNLYKVGHHGSLNATPMSLWKLFANRRQQDHEPVTPLKTVVSTLAGKHGDPEEGTEVPRSKLVAELTQQTDYYSTQAMEPLQEIFHDIDVI